MLKKIKFSIMENLKTIEKDELEPFLYTFLEEGGLAELL
jgi:hypothetical protein